MKKQLCIILTILLLALMMVPCAFAENAEESSAFEALNGKKVLFVGNSHVYRGLTVIDKDLSVLDQASRSNDTGYFYQLCKASGIDVSVTNWTFSGHALYHIFGGAPCTHSGACEGENHEEYLTDRYFDYVFINPGVGTASEASFVDDVTYIRDFFYATNPDVKAVILGNASVHGINQNNTAYPGVTEAYKTLEQEGFIIADWGRLLADVINGERTVPGATKTFTKSSFIVSDGYHANALTGYITTLFAYCAVTGEKAEGQPYDFCDNAALNASFDMPGYMATWYTNGESDTNFYEIMQSDADMLGLQKLTDTLLAEKPYLHEEETLAKSKDGVVLRMGLVADSHIANVGEYSASMETALEALNTVGGMDVLGLVGDIVWQADTLKEQPYTILKDLLTAANVSNTTEGATPYIFAMGNHEHLYGVDDKTLCAEAVELFEAQMEQAHNFHQEYNGYHVLAVGSASHGHQWEDGTFNYNEAWVMEEIKAIEAAEDYSSDEPIFLLMHYPVAGSVHRGVSNFGARHTEEFQAFLRARPYIVNVSAHTHIALQLPQTICQEAGYTAFQAGVIGDITSVTKKSQVSFIDVLENNTVKIYKIDLDAGKYIGEPWVIDIPAGVDGFQYTDAIRAGNTQAPTFTTDAAITFSGIGNYSASITFPTGTIEAKNNQQDNLIRQHRITVTKTETGELVKQLSYDADFCVVPQPKTLTREITDLEIAAEYAVSIEPMSMFGVYGEPLTAEFTTTGKLYEETLAEPITLGFDKTLVGEVTDDVGTTSYDTLGSSNVLLRQGDYFTYTVNVGEGQQIEEAGLYKLTYNYGSKRDATISSYVKWQGFDSYVNADASLVLPASGAYATYVPCDGTGIVQLREGANTIKIAISALSNNDGIYMKAPSVRKLTSATYMDYPINTSVYNAVTAANGTGTGSITSNIATSTYQTSSMITMRKGDYVVVPVMVSQTAAYEMDVSVKSDKALPSSVFKTAYTEESLDAAAALTTYTHSTGSIDLTSAWQTIGLGDAVVLEAGKIYYFKIAATTVGRSHIAQLSNIRFTDNGEYGTNANLASLSISEGYMDKTFDKDTTAYTAYADMPESGKITIDAAAEMSGATVSGAGEIPVSYGINAPAKIAVASKNGDVTKTYEITFVIAPNHASLGCTNAKMYVGTDTEGIDVSKLFNGTGVVKLNGSSGAGFGVSYNTTAYIVVDLGAEYDLNRLTWERTNQGSSVTGITVWGSNDPEFKTYEHLGTTYDAITDGAKASSSLTHKLMTTYLTATDSYRYVRINKPSGTNKDFYPVKMDIYGAKAASVSGETVTVPAGNYAVGDTLIAAAYDSTGRMTAASALVAENAPETAFTLQKENEADTVKVMVWKDLINSVPRTKAHVIK